MEQPAAPQIDRRRDRRQPAAFTLWLQPIGADDRVSAWLLDFNARGAALLVQAHEVPVVGTRLALHEMIAPDRFVREHMPQLPRFARVLRHDEGAGLTRRIAIEFEIEPREPLATQAKQLKQASMPAEKVAPLPPFPPPSPARPAPAVAPPQFAPQPQLRHTRRPSLN